MSEKQNELITISVDVSALETLLDEGPESMFYESEKNGKVYLTLSVRELPETSKYGSTHSCYAYDKEAEGDDRYWNLGYGKRFEGKSSGGGARRRRSADGGGRRRRGGSSNEPPF